MGDEIGRRDFLKKAALIGVGAAAVGGLAACAPGSGTSGDAGAQGTTPAADIKWDYEADVVVVGGGGAGFCAAIEAAQAGSSVLILEKGGYSGGSTALSGGMILAAGTDWQKSLAGYDGDTGESFAKQQVAYGCGLVDEDMVTEMCLKSAEEVQFMTDLGRVYTQVDVVPPIWAYDTEDTWAPRSHWDPSAQGGHFALLQGKADSFDSVTTLLSTEVVHLVKDAEKGVIGVEALENGKATFAKAHKAVILTTAGIDDNLEMARQYTPQQFWGTSLKLAGKAGSATNAPTNTGDGIRMGIEAGADQAISQSCVMADRGYHGGVGVDFYSTYEHEPNPYGSTSMIGEILVNAHGNRFVQEDADWGYVCTMTFQECVRTGAGATDSNVWCITDATNVRRWDGFGLPRDAEAQTIEELAIAIGVPADNLAKTIAKWNEITTNKGDPDFDRRTDFGVIATPPFYAQKNYVSTMGSAGGLKINIDTQVLDTKGNPIPRLFAAGMVAGGWVGPFYPGCGWAVLGTVHWGRKAGQKAAALEAMS